MLRQMKRDKSKGEGAKAAAGTESRVVGEVRQRVETVLGASGQAGPALAALEGAAGLFVLTGEQLLLSDPHGIRRVTLRDLARIHSDAEGTLRVETPAGVAMSASLIGFDGDEVQQFFGQVRDVTAQVKSLSAPPAPPRRERPSAEAIPTPVSESEQVTVTAVRRGEEAPTGPAPRITVNRGGKREELPESGAAPRENALGLTSVPHSEPDLPPAGSVEIRAVRQGQRPPITPLLPPREPLGTPQSSEEAWAEPQAAQSWPAEDVTETTVIEAAPASVHTEASPPNSPAPVPAPQPQPKPKALAQPLRFTESDLNEAVQQANAWPARLKTLGWVLGLGALICAVLMFMNAQRLFALWVLLAGISGSVALFALAALAHLQVVGASRLAASPSSPASAPVPDTSEEPQLKVPQE